MSDKKKPREFISLWANGKLLTSTAPADRNQLKLFIADYDQAIELLRKVVGQNQTRGYPTGIEWMKLVKKIDDSGILES